MSRRTDELNIRIGDYAFSPFASDQIGLGQTERISPAAPGPGSCVHANIRRNGASEKGARRQAMLAVNGSIHDTTETAFVALLAHWIAGPASVGVKEIC